jgi:hypothetical protein
VRPPASPSNVGRTIPPKHVRGATPCIEGCQRLRVGRAIEIHCTSSSSEARTWAAGDGRQRIEAGLAQIRLRSRISTASGPGMSQSISPPKRATPYDKQRSCRGRFKARSLGLRIQAIDRTIAGQTKQAWATWNRDFTRNLFHIDSPLIGACLQAEQTVPCPNPGR